MQQVGGVWLPAHEEHMVQWMEKTNHWVDGKLTYQYSKLDEALKHVKQYRTAIDIGAHCGTWSMHLAKRFALLVAIEPVDLHVRCLLHNLEGAKADVEINTCVLSNGIGIPVSMQLQPGSSGDSSAKADEKGSLRTRVLDEFEYRNVDFIKVDCNGFELPVLHGAHKTLIANRPCISVEQKAKCTSRHGLPEGGAIEFLQGLGAHVRHEHGGVFVLSWD